MKEKQGKNILVGVGWLSVILAVVTPSILLGIIAVCMGLVLRKDYEERKHGMVLIVMGIMSGFFAPVLGVILVWYLQKSF